MRRRGQIQARGKGKWLVRFYLGMNGNGKRDYHSRTVLGTRKEAEAELTKMLRDTDTGAFVVPTSQTVAEYIEGWLKSKVNAQAYTRRVYARYLNKHIIPALGRTELRKLRREQIQAMVTEKSEAGSLAPVSLKFLMTLFGSVLNTAVTNGDLQRTPMHGVVVPKAPRRRMATLTAEQVALFLETTRGTWGHALWTILLTTGMRPGEALALRWEDLIDNRLHVQRSLKRISGETWLDVGPVKRAASNRAVVLPEIALLALKEHRANQVAAHFRAGIRPDFIFCTRKGALLHPTFVHRLWTAALKQAGLPHLRLYDARHTHASNLLTAKVNPKVVQERLGHANVQTTLEVYSHVLPEVHEETAAMVDRMLQQQKPSARIVNGK